jgi:hypothetical protein
VGGSDRGVGRWGRLEEDQPVKRCRRVATGLAVFGLVALAFLTVTAQAEPPRESSWGSVDAPGEPVDAGFADAGYVAFAAGVSPGVDTGDCPSDTGSVDLFLVTFPDGDGCVASVDTSQNRDIEAIATADELDRVFVALAPTDAAIEGPNVFAYDVGDGSFTEAWSDQLPGPVLAVDADPQPRNVPIAFENPDATQPFRLTVFDENGERTDSFGLPGEPFDLQLSESGHYVAVGGNLTQDGEELGWAQLYDLDAAKQQNPLLDRKIREPREGVTVSVAASNRGGMAAGSLGGDVRFFQQNGSAQPVFVDNDAARVDVTADGKQVIAAAGSTVASLTPSRNALTEDWNRTVNATADQIERVGPHTFVRAGNVHAFGPDGQRLWETTGGEVLAVDTPGTGLAIGAERGGGTGGPDSTVFGRVLEASLSLSQNGTPTISPGSVGVVDATVDNRGSSFLNLTPTAPNASGVNVRSVPASFGVAPDRQADVAFRIDVAQEAPPGERTIEVAGNARPIDAPAGNITIDVGARSNVTLSLLGEAPRERSVTQEQTVRVRLLLENEGNTDADVEVDVVQGLSQGENWPVEIEPGKQVTIPGDARSTAVVALEVPVDAEDGTRNEIAIRASTNQGSSAIGLDLTVNPFRVLEIEPRTQTKQVAPGGTIPFNLSVLNKGSVDANVSLRASAIDEFGDPVPPVNQSWGIALNRSLATVAAGSGAPVEIELSAPGNVSQQDERSIRVQLVATAKDGTRATGTVSGVVDPALAAEDESPRREPFPGSIAVATTVAVTAAAWRRKP